LLRFLRRAAAGLLILVVGCVLAALGVPAGGWLALVGIVALLLAGLLSPWPWQDGWHDW
jgi:uncharacterized protein (DUF58 family)